MRFKHRHFRFICFGCCLLFILFAINALSRHTWKQLECNNRSDCVKILFVSDPQIIGERNEVLHFLTPLTIWHSDRYLQKSYREVYNFISPDIVVFLGDLMDEGSIATDAEFSRYRRRFFHIFPNSSSSEYLWIPGDNDIGGEGDEPINNRSLHRFYKTFGKKSVTRVKKLVFTETNETPNNLSLGREEILIGLSHFPVGRQFENTNPRIFFTGHEHVAKIIIKTNIETNVNSLGNEIVSYSLLNEGFQREIRVPTCSYRMGSTQIGFGYALFDTFKQQLDFQVIWTHDRCPYYLLWPCFIFYGLF